MFIVFLCAMGSLQVNGQDIEKTKKINAEIHSLIEARKSKNQLRNCGLEQIGSDKIGDKSAEQKASKFKNNWIVKNDAVLITAICNGNLEGLKNELKQLGIEQMKTYSKSITGYIPMNNVPKLDNCKYLLSAAPNLKPITNSGEINSEGDLASYSQNARKRFNVDGSGIKIGILSDGYNFNGGAEEEVAAGELPGIGNPFGFNKPVQVISENREERSIDEGRAMAQIIHDVAPGAELFFYSANNGYNDFADGVKTLASKGCNIIVDDVRYYADPMFQDGLLSQAIDEVTKKGVIYFAAAGNYGNASFESDYKSVTVNNDDDTTTEFFDFEDGNTMQTITIPAEKRIILSLQWDAPSILAGDNNPAPKTDLDFFLFDALTGELVASSNDNNINLRNNLEVIIYENSSFEDKEYFVVISKVSGENPTRIKYIDFSGNILFTEKIIGINASSTSGQANAKNAISVGANDAVLTPAFGNNYELQSFSSVGGIKILLDTKGNRIPAETRMKPDLVGPDTVSTSAPRFSSFSGTSAAAPHLAAIAALIKQSNKSLTPAKIKEILIQSAEDMDNPYTPEFDKGFDFATGYGFVIADKAIAIARNKPTIYRYEIVNSATQKVHQIINDNSTVDLSDIEKGALLNIKASATDGNKQPKATILSIKGDENVTKLDNQEPYAFFGDNKGVYNNWFAKIGSYKLLGLAVPNSQSTTPDSAYRISFNVVNNSFASILLLTGGDPNTLRPQISEGSKIDLKKIDEKFRNRLNVQTRILRDETNSKPKQIGEVRYKLSGTQNYSGNDIKDSNNTFVSFYDLFSDSEGKPTAWTPTPVVGKYKLEIQTLARRGDLNTAGKVVTVNFEIIDTTVPTFTNGLVLSPNPSTSGMVKINTISKENLNSINVYDSNGTNVFSTDGVNNAESELNLSKLNSGLYIVKAIDDKGAVHTNKLVINNN